MIILNGAKIGGKLFMGRPLNTTPQLPPEEECVVSTRSHNTTAMKTAYIPSNEHLMTQYGAAPGSVWSFQSARWTTPYYGPDINEYAVEPGPMEFYVDDVKLDFSGRAEDQQNHVSELVEAIRRVPGWMASIDYSDGVTGDPVLVVGYKGGVPKTGLRIAYPQDSTGDTSSHPAVEILFNGNWRHGRPVDGNCETILAADYQPRTITFPGQFALSTRTFRGSNGEPTSTASTAGPTPDLSGPQNPAIVSSLTVSPTDPIETLGFDSETNYEFYIDVIDGEGYKQSASYFYNPLDTVQTFVQTIAGFAYNGVRALINPEGHIVIINENVGAPSGLAAFDIAGASQFVGVFGSETPEVTSYRKYRFLTSINRFELTTPIAQFSDGPMEYGFERDYDTAVRSLGVSGTDLNTVGDLIAAINALDSGAEALAYLENGRLVIAVKNVENDPDVILKSRYVGETEWRSAVEILYGANEARGDVGYRYDDIRVAYDEVPYALTASLFQETLPLRPAYPVVPSATVRLGDRVLSLTAKLSDLYPVGHVLVVGNGGNPMFGSGMIEVSATNTLQDAFNHIQPGLLAFGTVWRFVEADGTHNATTGFVRMTGDPTVLWYNPVTKASGVADRLFHNAGDDGTAPSA